MAPYQFLEAPHLTNEIIGRLIRYDSHLVEVRRELGKANCKLDLLLSSSTVGHAFGSQNLSAPIGPDQTQTQNGPLGLKFNTLVDFEERHQWNPDFGQEAPTLTLGDLYTLLPRTAPASMVFRNGEWADPAPTIPKDITVPLTFTFPGGATGGDGSQESFGDTFPGSGNDCYQSTLQWTDIFGEMAEVSATSLVTTKPYNIDNETREGSNSLAVSGPGGGFNRGKSTERKTECLNEIRNILSIPRKGEELLTLQTIIQRLGGTVPAINEPTGSAIRNLRVSVGDARRSCFKELGRLVGFEGGRVREVKILERVLDRAKLLKGGKEGYEAYLVPGPSA